MKRLCDGCQRWFTYPQAWGWCAQHLPITRPLDNTVDDKGG